MCVDDFSRFTWVDFIRLKADTFKVFQNLCTKVQREKNCSIGKIVRIESDHGREFENTIFTEYCNKQGIAHEFLAPKTPQQNGVVERKNKTLQEMAHVMLNFKCLSYRLWAEAVHTTCYTVNRVYFRPGTRNTPYEIWKEKKPNLSYFHVFGSVCYILKDREPIGKLDAKSDERVFFGYSPTSHAYRVYNKRTQTIIESINVVIDDFNDESKKITNDEIYRSSEEGDKMFEEWDVEDNVADEVTHDVGTLSETQLPEQGVEGLNAADQITRELSSRIKKNHPAEEVIG